VEQPLLELQHVKKEFRVRGKVPLVALADINLHLDAGESIAVAGESGCGKSTLAKLITLIEKPTSGSILLYGEDITHLDEKARRVQRRNVQMVFQHPAEAISTRMTLGQFLKVPLVNFSIVEKRHMDDEVDRLLSMVGLPSSFRNKYAYEVSGGELQRCVIARALAARPKLILLDEATSALDVSIQQEILELLIRLQKEQNVAYIFITHDLSLVAQISSRLLVMYRGHIVEELSSCDIKSNCVHPYSRFLMSSVFSVTDGRKKPITVLPDDPAEEYISVGCPFKGRCPKAITICDTILPQLRLINDNTAHYAACHIV